MNILVDDLPEAIEFDGVSYELNCDFRTCMQIMVSYEDDSLADFEKKLITLNMLFKEVPPDTERAYKAAIRFLDAEQKPDTGEAESKPRVYSFTKDANLIYAAFRQTHGIDLQKENLHWWQFIALFNDLGADTAFLNMVNLRRRILSGKAGKEEKELAEEMGDSFVIKQPENLSYEEHSNASAFWDAWNGGEA